MDNIMFRLRVPESDGSVGTVDLTDAMAHGLYLVGLKEITSSEASVEGSARVDGHEVDVESTDGEWGLAVEWDGALTQVSIGNSELPPGEAAEVIALGVRKALLSAISEVAESATTLDG